MIKIISVAFVGVVASLLLKRVNSNISFAAAIITGVIILGFLYKDISNLVTVFKSFVSGYGVSDGHVKLLIKVLGISYITQFGSSIAEECGEKFIAGKIEFAGKIIIISLSLPLLINLLESIMGLL